MHQLLAVSLLTFLPLTAAAQDPDPHPIKGLWKGTIKDEKKKDVIMRVAMHAPQTLPERKTLGLLLLHHGFNGNENNYIGGTVECAKRLGLTEKYVIISGKSRGAGWTTGDDEYVLRLIEWARKKYPIDPRRIFCFGSSNGAAFVGRFGWEHQEIYAAVVGYCGSYNFNRTPARKMPPVRNAAETKTEWYFVHGGDDSPQNSRRACDQLQNKGYRYIFRKLDGYGHTDIWGGNGHPDKKLVNAVRDDWFTWIHALRHKEIPPTKAERSELSSLRSRLMRAKGAEADAMIAELSRIGSMWGGKVVSKGFKSVDTDVKAKAVGTTGSTLYGRPIVLELLKLAKDKSDAVRSGAFDGLELASNYRYAEAQQILGQIARSSGKPVDQRVRAVQGLGRTIKLALAGNFEDTLVVWTLVLLLGDKELQVREAAFAALKDGVKDTFGYAPDLEPTELKVSVGKWKSWASKVAGFPNGRSAKRR